MTAVTLKTASRPLTISRTTPPARSPSSSMPARCRPPFRARPSSGRPPQRSWSSPSRPAASFPGSAFNVTVTAVDPFNNTDTSYNGTRHHRAGRGFERQLERHDHSHGHRAASRPSPTWSTRPVDRSRSTPRAARSPAAVRARSPSLRRRSPSSSSRCSPRKQRRPESAFATQPVIYEEDAFGNLVTGDNSTVVTAYLGSGTGPLDGTVAETVSGGVATFTGLSDSAAGTITFSFTGAGLTSIPSVPVVINPAAPAQAGDPDRAVGERDGRTTIRNPARDRRGRQVRQSSKRTTAAPR